MEIKNNSETVILDDLELSNDFAFFDFVSLHILKSVSNIILGNSSSKAIPGAEITYKILYDNDSNALGRNVVISDTIPNWVTYVTNSAENYNLHTGGAVEVEYFDKSTSTWQDQEWDDTSNLINITNVHRIFAIGIGTNTGNGRSDTAIACDGIFPDNDAGKLLLKVIIK